MKTVKSLSALPATSAPACTPFPLAASDFIRADFPELVFEGIWLENDERAQECQGIIDTINAGARQAREWAAIEPALARQVCTAHNSAAYKLCARLAALCRLETCRACNLLFFPEDAEHSVCYACFEEGRRPRRKRRTSQYSQEQP